jgi:choline dehydrogenase-like flavoprotein
MLIDTSKEVSKEFPDVDICIVGSGPAGITLARQICRSGLRVCLLESGGHKPSEAAQNLNTGAVDSVHGYREQTLRDGRRRQFGGSGNLWNHELRGQPARHIRYVPLDEIDFERRTWVPESGWPFSRREIQSFYESAQRLCGIGKFDYRAVAWENGAANRQVWQTEKIESIVTQFGSPDIFLERYRRELLNEEKVIVVLNAVLLGLRMDPLSRAITSAYAGTLNGRKFHVRAQAFVLAAGGLENARILLLQGDLQPGGLGNQHDMVGCCFMDHPSITLGTLLPFSSATFQQAGFYDQHEVAGQTVMGILRIRPDVLRQEKILNLCAVLAPHFKNFRANAPAVLHQLSTKGLLFILRRHFRAHHYDSHVDIEPSRPLRQRLLKEYYSESHSGWSRLAGLDRRFSEFGVRCLVEQSPDRSNRVMLGEQTDVFGQRKTRVVWRWSELDLYSIRQAQKIFRSDLAAVGVGTFAPAKDAVGSQPLPFNSPHHFMGTTRMHDNPRNGVVDADCRVHDVPNLFIAGSSVFPTGGFANPTLTIVALTLRLAAHLESELRTTPEIRAGRTSEVK